MAKTSQMELDFNLMVKSSWKLKRRRYVCKEGQSYLAVCDSVGQLQASVRAGRVSEEAVNSWMAYTVLCFSHRVLNL